MHKSEREILKSRRQVVSALLKRATSRLSRYRDMRALLLVGSWAEDRARSDSDVDIVLLTTDCARYLDGTVFQEVFDTQCAVKRQNWGMIEECRLMLSSGLEIEIGVGSPEWAAIDPVDPGTFRVVRDGFRILYDPEDILSALVDVCGSKRA